MPLLVFVFCLLSVATAAAQESLATLSGRVVLAVDGTPLVAASVVVQHPTTGPRVAGALSGPDGRFVVRGLAAGSYAVRITFPGLTEVRNDLTVSGLNASYDLGDVRLQIESVTEDVKITTDAIRVAGLDTQVYRLDAAPTQSTGTLLDALKNLPGVTVDQEGKVSLRGRIRSRC
jgi:hypothetical protein